MGGPSISSPPPAPPIPTPLDPTVLERRRRARLAQRSGRSMTTLTSPMGLLKRGPIATPSLIGGKSSTGGGDY